MPIMQTAAILPPVPKIPVPRNAFTVHISMFPGNENEQPSLKPLEKKILHDFGLSRFVVCTDAGLAAASNRRFNDISGRSYIVTQSLKTMKKHLQDWVFDPSGWKTAGSDTLHGRYPEYSETKHVR